MDRFKSIELEKELKGEELDGYLVGKFVNNGKSAAVFKAIKDGKPFALKIFDNELIERFGHEIQTKRIEQEIALKNHNIQGLIGIHEGGSTELNGQTYYYLIMDFIEGKNLMEFIQENQYDETFIKNTLSTLYNTTEDLLKQKRVAHRDIKPENIMIDSDGKIILMDLGVLKLIGAKSFSDEEEKQFVGTLRYAPPEFLMRNEEDNDNGWRAVNLYQIGATLHDLVMKKALFEDRIPYSNLVIAIKDDMPSVSNVEYSFQLLQLTRNLLTKDPNTRLKVCTEKKINSVFESDPEGVDDFDKEINDIMNLRVGHQAKFDEIEKLQRDKDEIRRKQKETGQLLLNSIDKGFKTIQEKGVFNEMERSERFLFDSDKRSNKDLIQNYLFELKGDLKMGFPKNLLILVRMSNDENGYTEIDLLGIFPSVFRSNKNATRSPMQFFQELIKEQNPYNRNQTNHSIPTVQIYSGVIEFDEPFERHLISQIVKLIHKALKSVEKVVESELKWYEDLAKSTKSTHTRITTGQRSILIDKL